MKEINFSKYISNKDLPVGEVKLQNNLKTKIFFTEFNDVYLNPKLWSVITKDLYLFNDFERYLSPYKHNKEIIFRQNEIEQKIKSIHQIKGSYFLFGAEENYWHFMIDFIPRLICLKYVQAKVVKVIVSDKLSYKFLNFIKKICNKLDINEIDFLQLNQENLIYSFDKLIFTSRPSINFTSSFFYKLFNSDLINKNNKNIYVKRGNVVRRKVLNEDALIEFIKKYDYEIIDCFELEIDQQINIFSQAKNIIIPSGAAMANLIFIPNNTNVIEIRSNLDGDFSKKLNLQNRFSLFFFNKTIKFGDNLRKDIVVDIHELKKFIEEKNFF